MTYLPPKPKAAMAMPAKMRFDAMAAYIDDDKASKFKHQYVSN